MGGLRESGFLIMPNPSHRAGEAGEPAVPRPTPKQLEAHLWQAANILRGKIDSSDFKHYIFGLLFYKRINDVWEEEYDDRLRRLGDPRRAAAPKGHRFHLPREASWSNLRGHTVDIGRRLNAAFRAIEKANPRLAGVFQDVDFDNPNRFPDATLMLLLEHFEKHRLRNSDVEPDMLGNAYEYLIGQFADDAGKKGGEFYTPKQVVRLIIECLQPQPGMAIYDPACGSGGMLLEASHYLERQGVDPGTLQLFGQEMNLNTWAICQMNLFLHGIDDAHVVRGDTLRDPKHLRPEGGLATFDRVLANPPFSLKSWGHETWKSGDRLGRNVYGCPPPSYGDLAFVQHMVASLEPAGMLGVVLPHGILFRGAVEAKIRRGLVEDDLVEAVLGLPQNLFYGTGISACVVIMNRDKPRCRRSRVLFVDGAHEELLRGRLTDRSVERLSDAFRSYQDQEHFARVATREEIEANSFDLSIGLYVQPEEAEELIDVQQELEACKRLRRQLESAEGKVHGLLEGLGFDP